MDYVKTFLTGHILKVVECKREKPRRVSFDIDHDAEKKRVHASLRSLFC